ncbi:MAG TPA: hypothetical protein H9818_10295 [Candidatus Phocaeicola gallistercoris]|jgi:hypothetical protein|nr:hypothetical protein [Candidatus Phocaeicola gallistercoris]
MLAIEIQINREQHYVIAAENIAFIDIEYGDPSQRLDDIYAFGTDDSCSYTWYWQTPHQGDHIKIRIVDVDKSMISSPQSCKKKDRKEMKREFEQLKEELTNMRLL